MEHANNFNNANNKFNAVKKQPEFFSLILSNIIYTVNSTFGVYIIFNLIIYSYYYIFGKDFMINMSELSIFFNENFLTLCLMSLFIALGVFAVKRKSFSLFIVYIALLMCINVNYFFISRNTPNSSSSNANSENLITNITNKFFKILIIATNLLICFHCIYFYFITIGYFKQDLNDLPIGQVINEIKLRTDMMKMNYNSFMIGTGIYKYLPGLLYKKEDYYFMTSYDNNADADMSDYVKEKSHRGNTSEENLNSKSTLDYSEYEPLKN